MASRLFVKPGQMEQELRWAKIWFQKLAEFHRHPPKDDWQFTRDHVIAFLRSKRDAGLPAWKRLKIIRGLIVHRRFVSQTSDEDLIPLQEKMQEIILIERARQQGYDDIEESVGKIDPRESDAIQEFRRALRKTGKALRTERSYVGKVKAFMTVRSLTTLADFESITGADVEAHLTDLAVDGNVAASTQNTAFHGLLSFFTLVLKRDMGKCANDTQAVCSKVTVVLCPWQRRFSRSQTAYTALPARSASFEVARFSTGGKVCICIARQPAVPS